MEYVLCSCPSWQMISKNLEIPLQDLQKMSQTCIHMEQNVSEMENEKFKDSGELEK